jgi:hypothetical protein
MEDRGRVRERVGTADICLQSSTKQAWVVGVEVAGRVHGAEVDVDVDEEGERCIVSRRGVRGMVWYWCVVWCGVDEV